MEASTGIEPVYTDLQSSAFPNKINAQDPKKYQDKAGTRREPDTWAKSGLTNENPGALAGASGVKVVFEADQLPPQNNTPGRIIKQHWGVAA